MIGQRAILGPSGFKMKRKFPVAKRWDEILGCSGGARNEASSTPPAYRRRLLPGDAAP